MNDIPSKQGLSTLPEAALKPEGLWGKTVAFLNRDIKSFLRGSCEDGESVEQSATTSAEKGASAPTAPPVESLVDVNKLPDIAFRREVLDWRDNFHANVTITLSRLHVIFVQHVCAEIGNTSLFRTLITRPTDEVLQDSFERIVRSPLIATLREEEVKLKVCAQKWGFFGNSDLTFDIGRLNAECLSLHDVGFKPSNKDLIVSRLQALILGPAGLAEHYRDQALHLARKILEIKESW